MPEHHATGSCLCGAVRYELRGPFSHMAHCHCSRFFSVAFCTACGSDVARKSLERKAAVIPAGALDTDPGMGPTAHIFVGSKASWFTITDGLPQHAEMPS